MTEQYRNPQRDPRMSPHQLLLHMLAARMSPHDDALRVIWGTRPTLLLGGVVKMKTQEDQVDGYNVSVTSEPWLTPDTAVNPHEVLYDIHLNGNTTSRRFAVCANAAFTAQSMGRLTIEKFIRPVDAGIVQGLTHLAKAMQPSEQQTAVMHTQLAEWGVVEPISQVEAMYPDMGMYHYTEVLKQEWIKSDE